jgi:hypothetical protein
MYQLTTSLTHNLTNPQLHQLATSPTRNLIGSQPRQPYNLANLSTHQLATSPTQNLKLLFFILQYGSIFYPVLAKI